MIGLAFWAYRENYATQQVLTETQTLQREIGEAQERLSVLRAEWAYLNRPDRLRELARSILTGWGCCRLRPDQFGRVDEVSYPRACRCCRSPIIRAIDVAPRRRPQP